MEDERRADRRAGTKHTRHRRRTGRAGRTGRAALPIPADRPAGQQAHQDERTEAPPGNPRPAIGPGRRTCPWAKAREGQIPGGEPEFTRSATETSCGEPYRPQEAGGPDSTRPGNAKTPLPRGSSRRPRGQRSGGIPEGQVAYPRTTHQLPVRPDVSGRPDTADQAGSLTRDACPRLPEDLGEMRREGRRPEGRRTPSEDRVPGPGRTRCPGQARLLGRPRDRGLRRAWSGLPGACVSATSEKVWQARSPEGPPARRGR